MGGTLYDRDFYEWAAATVQALRNGRLSELDVEHLAEEIEDLGNRDARELYSRITTILEHRLKLHMVRGPILDQNRRGWEATILRQQDEISTLLTQSPSLRRLVDRVRLEECYRRAARLFQAEFDLVAPAACPFTESDVLG
jgi:hypothetical protein